MSNPVYRSQEGGFREEVFNVFLAILLNERGIVSVPENILKISSSRRMPDITIAEFWGVRIIIEGRIYESYSDEKSLISDSRKRIEEGLSPICVAVLYPPEIRHANWQDIRNILAQAKLRVKILTDSTEDEWFDTDIDGLASILRRTYELLVKEDVVNNAVILISDAIEKASDCFSFSPSIPDRLRTILGLFSENNTSEKDLAINLRICRIACLTLLNAQIFHEVLASHEPRVQTLRRTLDESNILDSFSEVWRFILDEINYVPIFQVAREILLEMPSNPETEKAIKILGKVALDITQKRASLKHDLMGRIFHRLLIDAKYFGAFYTKIPSATLLLELTFDPKYWDIDFSSIEDMKDLKIADLACGTGTLLKASLEAIVDDHVKSIVELGKTPELIELHKLLVEEIIYGYDVLPFATHLAASTLALHEPDVPFFKMNLFVLPLSSYDSKFTLPRLGSLDFLSDRPISLQKDLFGALVDSPSTVTGTGDIVGTIRIPDLDLCVMNPPFTRSVGGNLLFGNFPTSERRVMQKRLREIVRSNNIRANITAGLGSVFVALADKYLKDNGHISLVLPKSLLSGVAWAPTRDLLSEKYSIRYIISSHEPNGWNFSENTQLSECLIIADKKGNSVISEVCFFINLWEMPKTNIEALTLSSLIFNSTPVKLIDSGICELVLNGKKYGEIISIPSNEISENLWMHYTAFAQTELIRAGYYLNRGEIYIPGDGICGSITLTKLGSLFTIGPDRRDIHDGFNLSPRQTVYPTIWGHDSKDIVTVEQLPNNFLSPLSSAKRGRPLRDSNLLWSRSGRLLIAERLWLNTHKLVAVWCPQLVLSNVWWTLRLKTLNNNSISENQLEKIICVWLNSTLGLILTLFNRTETRGAWIDIKKPNLSNLNILDPFSLTPEQITDLIILYDRIADAPLLSLKEAMNDDKRQLIDDEIARILQIPNYGILRNMISIEPNITLQPI